MSTAPSAPAPAPMLARLRAGQPMHTYALPGAPGEPADAAGTELGGKIQIKSGGGKTRIRLPLYQGEAVWGFGQRLDGYNLRGHAFEVWAEDSWNRYDTSYFAVPWFISSRGYGLFINSSARIKADLGRSDPGLIQLEVPGEGVELWVLQGTPAAMVSAYSELVGRPQPVPDWIFQPWLSRNSYLSAYEVDRNLARAAASGLNFGAVVLESWEQHLHNFRFATNRYPDPAGWIRKLNQRGVQVVCWTTASIWTGDPSYEQARDRGFLVRNADGSEYITRWLENGRKMDFRSEAARSWWRDQHRPLIEMGVGGFKTDGGEHMPDPWFHNQHPYYYQRATLDAYAAAGRPGITFARSANPLCAGNSTFWGGDQHAVWSNLAAVVRGGLSAAWSGFFFWSHDIGGYTGTPEKDLYLRWLQLGAFSPMMQLHGITAREPWHYDRETLDLARAYFRVRERLQPYLVELGQEARAQGHPLWRPLAWAYPDDEATWPIGDQFLLGPDLLVAPMLTAEARRTIYLPDGRWLDLWDQTWQQGPTQLVVEAGRNHIPVYAREASAGRWRDLLKSVPRPPPSPLALELDGPRNERGLVPGVRYVQAGEAETVSYRLANHAPVSATGTLSLQLPPGFRGEPPHHTFDLGPGQTTGFAFRILPPPSVAPGSYPIQGQCRVGNLSAKTPRVTLVYSPPWKVLGPLHLGMKQPHALDDRTPDLKARWPGREGDLLWQDVRAESIGRDGWLDLGPLTAKEGEVTSYAYAAIPSPTSRRILFKAGSGDALTIWLNGQEVLRRDVYRNPEADEDTADVTLRGGVNHVLIRISRSIGANGFYFRLAEPERTGLFD